MSLARDPHRGAQAARRAEGRFPASLALSVLLHAAGIGGLALLAARTSGGERVARAAALALEPAAPAAEELLARLEREQPEPLEEPRFDEPPEPVLLPEPRELEPLPTLESVELEVLARDLPLRPFTQPEPALPPAPSAAEPASAASEPAETVVVGERQDLEPLLLEAPPPRYPPRALLLGLEGTVLVRLTVGADGSVLRTLLERSSGHRDLDRAALEALLAWRFRPGLRAGLAADFELLHRVRFELRR